MIKSTNYANSNLKLSNMGRRLKEILTGSATHFINTDWGLSTDNDNT